MNTVIVEDEALDRFLESIDVDEGNNKDGIRAMCEFKYSFDIDLHLLLR
jgi:hypothetical protein